MMKVNFKILIKKIEKITDTLAPYKQKLIRGNDKPCLQKPWEKKSWQDQGSKTGTTKQNPKSILKTIKQQRNKIVNMNKKLKKNYFASKMPYGNTSRDFWDYCKLYFTNKHIFHDERIRIKLNGSEIIDQSEIATKLNIKGVAERKQKLSAFASEFFYEQLFALFCFKFVVVVIKRVVLFT